MLLSSCFGILTAILSYISKTFRSIISLPVNFLKAVPVMAVIIYGLILLNANNVPIMACFLMCYPVVHTNILAGLDYLDDELLEMSKLYDFPKKTVLRYIYLPSLLPQIKASVSLMAGLSWKSVIAAEILSVPAFSMGYRLLEAKIYIETDILFAWIIAIVGLSLIFEKSISVLVGKFDIKEYSGSKIFHIGTHHLENSEISPISKIDSLPEVKLTQVNKRYGDKEVLKNFSMTFEAASITAIMAPSGKGKTTILRLITGLESPDSGSITITPPHSKLSCLFQEDRLLPWLNVFDNMAVALNNQSIDSDKAAALIYDMAEKLEISEALHKLPLQLSGGMKHRVAIGRALLRNAEVLILDEPFRGLDAELKLRLAERLKPYLSSRTSIIITHDNENVRNFADSVVTI
ncbi:MAG: ATP-binding cassette domain-containing protein [Eubacteriales bacterium]|nr:ATP-binding cassette domain-containing protein [Eubacteriales bacterium]MDD4390375.1 ATP-binding cassette domain-containing protein [Eubacteriales bacterium]